MSRKLAVLLPVAVAMVVGTGCPRYVAVPAPTTFTARIDSAPRGSVLSYARSLHYDTSPGVGDYRRVAVGCPACTHGPHVFLSPERGAAWTHATQLAQGRVLARLVNYDADPYPKLNLGARDTVYWWVDKKGPEHTWRSVYVSSDPARGLRSDSLLVDSAGPGHRHERWTRTLARFLWNDRDEALWIACDMAGCCKSSGADIY